MKDVIHVFPACIFLPASSGKFVSVNPFFNYCLIFKLKTVIQITTSSFVQALEQWPWNTRPT